VAPGSSAIGGGSHHSLESFQSLLDSLRHFAKSSANGDEPEMSRSMMMRRRSADADAAAAASTASSHGDEDDGDDGGSGYVEGGGSAAAEVTDDDDGEDDDNSQDPDGGGGDDDDGNPQSATATAAASSTYLSTDRATVTLVVPNSQLTRPGDWRYDTTPLRSHDWSSGCQRMKMFDGRYGQDGCRMAYDRLRDVVDPDARTSSSSSSGNAAGGGGSWADLVPSRGTAAVIGVLNVRDCRSTDDLRRAEEELDRWVELYSAANTTAGCGGGGGNSGGGGGGGADDDESSTGIIRRLFVFDSFEEECQHVDLTATTLGSNLVAFPPSDSSHTHMMDLHLNVVVNDLAVAIFRNLETRIRTLVAPRKAGFFSGFGVGQHRAEESTGPPTAGRGLSAIANIVSPGGAGVIPATGSEGDEEADDDKDGGGGGRLSGLQKLAGGIASKMSNESASSPPRMASKKTAGSAANAYLTTPLDTYIDPSKLSSKELDALAKRDAARREKLAADLSLLAGSPIDAYERYTHAAEMTKANQDPLWYAASLEGCAASFVAMADAGGHGVDEYLENNFQLPEDLMALALAAQPGGNEGRNKATVDKNKTTLPLAVFALTDEALSILSRHECLGGLYAELLLRLAWYAAEVEEGHLRCRWGEGEECYGGDVSEQDGSGPSVKRWQSTSIARLDIDSILVGSRGALLGQESLERSQKFVTLLHKAVSAGALDPRTRADVAATAARMCLIGVKTTQWGSSREGDSSALYDRLRMPRKAAYFTTVAAEAMATAARYNRSSSPDTYERAANLWLAACHLYTRDGNAFDGSGIASGYAWATLRASTLYALTRQRDPISAEVAAELLLALLGEISHDRTGDAAILQGYAKSNKGGKGRDAFVDRLDESGHGGGGGDLNDRQGRAGSSGSRGSLQGRGSLFAQAVQAGNNPFAETQSKWLENEPLPDAQVLPGSMISLNCVAPRSRFETVALAQRQILSDLAQLRQDEPTKSCPHLSEALTEEDAPPEKEFAFTVYRDQEGGVSAEELAPLEIVSAKIVKSESHLVLERAKAHGFSSKANVGTSMSTFFNPFAKKKGTESSDKVQTTLVAEGEERVILIEFANKLSVPLDVPSAKLQFRQTSSHAVEAPALSFTIPAKTEHFAVHFPVIIVASKKSVVEADDVATCSNEKQEAEPMVEFFDLVGLTLMCLNRTINMSLEEENASSDDGDGKDSKKKRGNCGAFSKHVPPPGSVYQRSVHNKPAKKKEHVQVRLEAVPAQPNLLVSFDKQQQPLDDEAMVPVHLSDGEIYTLPAFRLENDFGASGMGRMERLQILGVGMPGLPEEVLFDTDALAAAWEAEDDDYLSSDEETGASSEAFEEMMECDGLPPLKMKALPGKLSLKSINDKTKQIGEGSLVTFQIAATHDMGNQLANGGNVRIRFRYRGPSPNPATEIWRKREISLRIVRVKGPRISSLTFRSDLSWGSSYSELCRSLAQQKLQWESVPKWASSRIARQSRPSADTCDGEEDDVVPPIKYKADGITPIDESLLYIVGMDPGVHVCGDEVVVLMAVANETNSTIVLSNRKGLVGGFEGSPMPTVRVTSGVSVKIPVVIPRIERIDSENCVTDIAAELVARTALQWESEVADGDDSAQKSKRQGRVRIPSRCLREIIDEHRSFASRICKSPVAVKVDLGKDGEEAGGDLHLSPGASVVVNVEASINDWVPKSVVPKLNVILEFCCARKDSGNNALPEGDRGQAAFIWCGQLRRTMGTDEEMKHRARVAFLRPGTFAVSACAKISYAGSMIEETWWAPIAKTITIDKLGQ